MNPGGPMPDRGPGRVGNLDEDRLDSVLEKLNLNDKQKARLEEIKDEHKKTVEKVMEQARAGQIQREKAGDLVVKVREVYIGEVKEVLTAEQRKRFDDLMSPTRVFGDLDVFQPGGR